MPEMPYSYQDALKRLLGLPPYDSPTNYSRGDNYMAAAIMRQYGKSREQFNKDCDKMQRDGKL